MIDFIQQLSYSTLEPPLELFSQFIVYDDLMVPSVFSLQFEKSPFEFVSIDEVDRKLIHF